MVVRDPRPADMSAAVALAAEVLGPDRAGQWLRVHADQHPLLVADEDDEVIGVIAYRTDWFQCTMVSLVAVRPERRRRGVARALYAALERICPGSRLFSSTAETDAVSIRMHTALGFTPSGHIDNLPQGYRELLFYKRLAPSASPTRP
jgi:GNAT superfamily N-acetyltransferase